MCFLKLEENVEAMHSCDEALKHDENNEKALFRKATVCVFQNFNNAVFDFNWICIFFELFNNDI